MPIGCYKDSDVAGELCRKSTCSDELSIPDKKSELGKYLDHKLCFVPSVTDTLLVPRLELPSDVLCADREHEGTTSKGEDPGVFERDRDMLPAVKKARDILKKWILLGYPTKFDDHEDLDMIDCDENDVWEFSDQDSWGLL